MLIIFDCDGVLVDSEVISCRVVSECLADVGINVTLAEVMDRYIGVSFRTMLDDLRSRFDSHSLAEFEKRYQQRILIALKRDLKAIEGVEQALKTLTSRTCVASSSNRERIIFELSTTGLLRYFSDNLFSATQVAQGKPAPDLLLLAAAKMSASPEQCVVIEDSIPGIKAACAAGMRVLGFHGGSHCKPGHGEELIKAGALLLFKNMFDLPSIIANLS
ncbi:MAG: hypothetical protein APF81_25680 [Desulfosporosinus sp. BRH_c37]|nr:MAG: hypothetical protein APF81_25680 [Desulfosporosinus sp. BRH_c37]